MAAAAAPSSPVQAAASSSSSPSPHHVVSPPHQPAPPAPAAAASASASSSSASAGIAGIASVSKDQQQEPMDQSVDDVGCKICFDAHASSQLMMCRGCGITVHSECYGNPLVYTEPDDWLCEQCLWRAGDEPCLLCPAKGGPMKRCTDGRWAHLTCSLWVPECFYRLGFGREPTDVLQIPAHRWEQKCCHCGIEMGVCVSCSDERCDKVFHVTCGMKHEEDIYLEYKQNKRGADVVLCFCSVHAKKWAGKRKAKCVIRVKG